MPAARETDNPWVRLPWIGPIAALLAFAALYGFLRLTLAHEPPPSVSRPVTVSIIELPAPPAAQPQPAAPPQAAAPPPPPEPVKPVEIEPPKPIPEPAPAPRRPPPKRLPPVKPAPAQAAPETASPSSPTTPSQAPAAPATTSLGQASGNMSARAIYQPMPEIPDELRRRNMNLVAVARFRVGPDGKAAVDLIQPTPEPSLNRALLERLQTWRFFPAMADGKPVASVIDIRIPISVR